MTALSECVCRGDIPLNLLKIVTALASKAGQLLKLHWKQPRGGLQMTCELRGMLDLDVLIVSCTCKSDEGRQGHTTMQPGHTSMSKFWNLWLYLTVWSM